MKSVQAEWKRCHSTRILVTRRVQISRLRRYMMAASTIFAIAPTAGYTASPTNPSTNDVSIGNVPEVEVTTGVRGEARSVTKSMAPIDVVTSDDLQKTGKQNLREALSAILPQYTDVSGFQNQHGLAVKTAGLRGLSGTKVLVLVNGRRRHNSAIINSRTGPLGADLDLIPVSAVERIEVLTDGASAQYGSDAIAGVINIILKSNADGLTFNSTYGEYPFSVGSLGDHGRTEDIQINKGLGLPNNGFLNLSADIERQANTAVTGPIPRSTAIFFPANGNADPRETSESRYRYLQGGLPQFLTYSFAYNAGMPLTPDVSLYSYSTLSHRHSRGWGGFRGENSTSNNAAVYPEGYSIGYDVRETDFQSVIGVKGHNLAGWDWDLSTSYGRDDADIGLTNSLNLSLGPTSPHSFDIGHQIYSEWTNDLDVTRKFNTGLFTEPLKVAIGVERRNSTWSQTPGDAASYADGGWTYPGNYPLASLRGTTPAPGAQGTYGYSPDITGSYSRVSNAVYVDFDQKITPRWEVDAAGRFEHYDDVGSVPSGKISSRFQLSSTLAVRGTVSNGFAAPSLSQEHYKLVTRGYGVNALTGEYSTTEQVIAPANDPVARALGATALRPEKSLSYSMGIVFTPARDTSATLDAYQIDIRDRILQSTLLQGTAVQKLLAAAGLDPNQTVNYYTNAGHTQSRGIDLVAVHDNNYGKFGHVKWTLTSNQRIDRIKSLSNGPAVLTNAGVSLIGRDVIGDLTDGYPKNITSVSAAWTRGDWELLLKETRYSSVVGRSAVAANRDQYVGAAFITDVNLAYWLTKNARFSLGANNLFNKRPGSLTGAAATYATGCSGGSPCYSFYSPYGVNGGFYYARLELNW